MLHIDLIRTCMASQGLSGAALAEQCAVSKEAVSNWLNGESIPRPSKLIAIAKALQLNVEDLLLPDPSAPPEPVVAYRMRGNRQPSAAAREAGEEVGRHLRQLLPCMGVQFSARFLVDPKVDVTFISEAAMALRSQLNLGQTEPITHVHLLQLLKDIGAIPVPVYWGGDKVGHENAMSVYLPDSRTSWVLLNVGCQLEDLSYWLAHELGHCLTLHAITDQDGENFAELFAQALLHPEMSLTSAHDASRAPLGSKAIKSKTAKAGRTASEELFGTPKPSMKDLAEKGGQIFETPVFRALARWQKSEGGRSPAFVAAALNLKLGDATELSRALWDLED